MSWEVRTCTSQLEAIVLEHGNSMPPPPDGFAQPGATQEQWIAKDAMLQAGLIHLRSLDDLLRGSPRPAGRPPDIQAKDWFDDVNWKWPPRYWLDPRDRALIDWWVVHLSSLRAVDTDPPPWRLADYGAALCLEVERFFEAVETHLHPDRLAAFDYNVRGDAQARLVTFIQYAGT